MLIISKHVTKSNSYILSIEYFFNIALNNNYLGTSVNEDKKL